MKLFFKSVHSIPHFVRKGTIWKAGSLLNLIPYIIQALWVASGQATKNTAEKKYKRIAAGEREYGEEMAGQMGQDAAAEQQRILDAFSEIYSANQDEIAREEMVSNIMPELQNLLSKRFGATGEQLYAGEGDINAEVVKQMLARGREPGKYFEDTLAPELELARMMVNQEANKRGAFGGGAETGLGPSIRLENLGRAGVELAIRKAAQRQEFNQQQLMNMANLGSQFTGLSSGARSEYGNFYNQLATAADKAQSERRSGMAQGIEKSYEPWKVGQEYMKDYSMYGQSQYARMLEDLYRGKANIGQSQSAGGIGNLMNMLGNSGGGSSGSSGTGVSNAFIWGKGR